MRWVLLFCTVLYSTLLYSPTLCLLFLFYHILLYPPSPLTHTLTHSTHTLTLTHTHTHTGYHVKIAEFHRINDTPPEEPPLTQAEIGVELAKVSEIG
jgi:hypothetical protein